MAKVKANIEEFNAQVSAFVAKNPDRVLVIQKKLMLDAFALLVGYTPRDTGYLAFNWQATAGNPATGEVGTEGQSHGLPDSMRVLRATAQLKPYQKSWITNNAVYAERINNGWGSYRGAQMLERTVNDLIASNFGVTG